MPIEEQSWQPEAQQLGYSSEIEMLKSLYLDQMLSISQISKMLGYSGPAVRQRLINADIELRPRGGANNSERRLAKLTDDELRQPIHALVTLYRVHPATISNERRFRRKLKQQEMIVTIQDHPQEQPQS